MLGIFPSFLEASLKGLSTGPNQNVVGGLLRVAVRCFSAKSFNLQAVGVPLPAILMPTEAFSLNHQPPYCKVL